VCVQSTLQTDGARSTLLFEAERLIEFRLENRVKPPGRSLRSHMQYPRSGTTGEKPMRVPCFNLSTSLASVCLIALLDLGMGCSGTDLGAGSGRNIGSVGAPVGGATGVGGNAAGGGSTSFGGSNGAAGSASVTSTGGAQTAGAPTWTQLYNNYFNSACTSCHSSQSPVFTTAASMCTVLKQYNHIGNGTASLQTLITWFNQGGYMPLDTSPAPANAVADITKWQNAGAACP